MASGSARKPILAKRTNVNVKRFEVIEGTGPNPTPTPPAAGSIPRADRRGIVEAFGFGVSIYKISQRQGRPFKQIEAVLRDELDALQGQIRAAQSERIYVVRRSAA
jgi:hypothetical protein